MSEENKTGKKEKAVEATKPEPLPDEDLTKISGGTGQSYEDQKYGQNFTGTKFGE